MLYLLLLSQILISHDYHLSKTLIEQSRSGNSLEISMHIFIDDLELALQEQGHTNLFLCTEKESETAEQVVERYLQDQFLVEVNQKLVSATWIGKEVSKDLRGVWCYLEITHPEPIETITVTHSLLFDIYRDQRNIVQVSLNDGRKGFFLLEPGRSSESLK